MTEWTKEQQAEHRKLWVEALRSGKYTQARHRLRRGDAMCCLGVACEISGLGAWSDMGIYLVQGGRDSMMILPEPVKDWLGLSRTDSAFGSGYDAPQLTEMNDGGKTFAEIADVIEAEPTGLLA